MSESELDILIEKLEDENTALKKKIELLEDEKYQLEIEAEENLKQYHKLEGEVERMQENEQYQEKQIESLASNFEELCEIEIILDDFIERNLELALIDPNKVIRKMAEKHTKR